MSWTIETYKYAGHEIKIKYRLYNQELKAYIKGPRASGTNKKRYANDITKRLKNRIPFRSPTTKQIDRNVYDLYCEARKEIDTAIAAHAKKHGEEYK